MLFLEAKKHNYSLMKKSSYTVKLSSLLLCILCLLLISSPYIPQRINNIAKLIVELFLIIIIILQYGITKSIMRKCIPILLFYIVMIISTYMNHGVSSRLINAVITGGVYVLFYFVIASLITKYSMEYVVGIIKANIGIYMCILDFFVIVTWGRGLGGDLNESVYLLGNKFMLSYLHMFVLALLNVNSKKESSYRKKICRILLFSAYSIFICIIADTTMGIIGCGIVAILSILSAKRSGILELLANPNLMLSIFLGINAIFLLTDLILNNSFLTPFLLARSHTGSILSGRVVMYNITMEAIAQNPIWGYGINYDIVQQTLSFGNAQNGLLKMLLDFGCVGTALFLFTLYTSFKNAYGLKSNNITNGYIVFIYGMLICSLVEINLAAIFMLMCALLNGNVEHKNRYE